MSVTVLEGLQNAECNLVINGGRGIAGVLGAQQLKNCIALLDKGYSPNDLVEPLLEAAGGNIENVPNKPPVQEDASA